MPDEVGSGALDERAGGSGAAIRGPRILVAHPSTELYGSDRVFLDSVRALRDRGWATTVVLPDSGPLLRALRESGLEVTTSPAPVLRKQFLSPRGALQLLGGAIASVAPSLRLLRAVRPDVVYVSTVTIPTWMLLARLMRVPVVCHLHEAETGVPLLLRRLLALPVLAATRVVANSGFSRDTLVRAMPLLRGRTTVLANAVPGPERAERGRTELSGGIRLLYVGRLSPRKGPEVALRAVAELRRRGLPARLDLVGSVFAGYEWFEEQLRSEVRDSGLQDAVRFHGFCDDVWPYIASSDVVVVPSVADEPFGNTAVEAVLAARPVVASSCGGLGEAVAQYGCARLVPPGDPGALADAVSGLVADWPAAMLSAERDAVTAARRHDPVLYGERLDLACRQAAARVRGGLPDDRA